MTIKKYLFDEKTKLPSTISVNDVKKRLGLKTPSPEFTGYPRNRTTNISSWWKSSRKKKKVGMEHTARHALNIKRKKYNFVVFGEISDLAQFVKFDGSI